MSRTGADLQARKTHFGNLHSQAGQVRKETASTQFQPVREEFEFLQQHGIAVTPVHEDGEMTGLDFKDSQEAPAEAIEPSLTLIEAADK